MKELIEAYLKHTNHFLAGCDLIICDVDRSSACEDEQCYNIFALKDGQLNGAEITVTELLEFMWGRIANDNN